MTTNVRSWLRRTPQPKSLRIDQKEVLRVGEGKNKWKDVIDVLDLKQPTLLEALDGDGHVIRMTQLESDRDDDDEPAKGKGGKLSELAELGALIGKAYVDGAAAHAKAYELSFGENTKLVSLLAARLGGLEQAWQTTLEQRAEELAARAAESDDGGMSLLSGPLGPLIQGIIAKQMTAGEKPSVAKTNGVHKNGAPKKGH